MADEELKSLAVKIAMESGSFQDGVKNLKQQMNIIDSEFKAGVSSSENWGKSLDGLKANATALGDKINVQKNVVQAYQEQLKKSQETLATNAEKMVNLKSKVEATNVAYGKSVSTLGENDEATKKLKIELDKLNKEFTSSESLIRKNQSSVNGYTIQINNANGTLNKMQSELSQTSIQIKKMGVSTADTEKALEKLKVVGSKIGSAIAIGIGAAVVGMGALLKSSLDTADALQKQSDVTGLSVETLQEMKYAGEALGVELETITGAQAKLTKNMYAAKDGTGEQADAFKELGISVIDGNGHLRDAKVVMGEAFTALNKMGNETERDALAQKMFGKSAMELNPLIKAGGVELNKYYKEAQDVGAVISKETIVNMDKLGDTIGQTKLAFMGAIADGFAPLIPKLQEMADKVKTMDFTPVINAFKWVIDNPALVVTLLGVAVAIKGFLIASEVATAISAMVTVIKSYEIGSKLAAAGQWLLNIAMSANPIGIIIVVLAAVVAALIYFWNTNEGFRDALISAWEAIKNAIFTTWEAIKGFFMSAFNFIKDNWQNLLMIVNPVTAIAGILSLLYKLNPQFREWVNSIGKSIVDGFFTAINFIKELPSKMFGWGKDMIQGMIDGIKNMIGKIGEAVSGVAEKIRSFLHFSVPDEGPLTDYHSWMPDFMGGLATDIESNKHKVTNAIQGLTQNMKIGVNGSFNANSGSNMGNSGTNSVNNSYYPAQIVIPLSINGVDLGQANINLTAQQLKILNTQYGGKVGATA